MKWRLVWVLLILALPSAFATLCYQESANTSNQTGIDGNCGIYNGSYTVQAGWFNGFTWSDKVNDGNWSSYGYATGSGGKALAYILINYTIPNSISINNIWSVKDYNGVENLTITGSCLNNNILQLRVTGNTSESNNYGYNYWDCYNDTTWVRLRSTGGGYLTNLGYVYEEAMWWNITAQSTPVPKPFKLFTNFKLILKQGAKLIFRK